MKYNINIIASICTIVLLLFVARIDAQSILSQNTFGGSFTETVSQISPTLDSGFIVAANTSSTNGDVTGYHEGFGSDCWITKINKANQLQWQRTIGGSGNDVATSIRATTDSGCIVVGFSNSNDGDIIGNYGGYDFLVVKLDKNNAIVWQKSIGGLGDDIATDVRQTSDGGFIIAGYSNSSDTLVTDNHGSNDYFIVKLSANGTFQWQKSFGGTSNDKAIAIQQTRDSGYIVVGNSNSNDGDISKNNGNNDFWVIKLSSTGNLTWQKSVGGSGNDFASSVIQTLDGGFAVAGYTFSEDVDVTNNQGNYDYWVVKLDSLGSTAWQKTYGGTDNDYARAIIQTKEGGYVVGGYTASIDGDVSGNNGLEDEWVIRLDSIGNIQWQKALGGSNNDRLFAISKADGNNICVAGITGSWDGDVTKNKGSYDCWVVKLADLSILPLKLISFNAVASINNGNKNALLTWTTANESAIRFFKVEKSNNGIDFGTIGQVSALNKNDARYRFMDEHPAPGINYYRLKIIENNGTFSYSNVEKVVFEVNLPQITIYPNPTSLQEAKIQFNNFPVGHYTVSLFDMNGRRTFTQTIEHIISNATYIFKSSELLPIGYYSVQVMDGKGNKVGEGKMLIK